MLRPLARAGLVALLAGVPGPAPADTAPGREHIGNLAGCFAVTYRFYEDGVHDYFSDAYGLDRPVTELVEIVAQTPDSVTLMHSAVNRAGQVVPHFHEVWTHRPGEQGQAGAWTQAVWSRTPDAVNRELRYQCTAPWSLNRWACHAGRAPKPFRDYGAPFGFHRLDYEWLDRHNILLVTDRGWVQNEHNRKLDQDGNLVSYEIGVIEYERVDDGRCAAAAAR